MELACDIRACGYVDDACSCAVLLPHSLTRPKTHVAAIATLHGQLLVVLHDDERQSRLHVTYKQTDLDTITALVLGDIFNMTDPLKHASGEQVLTLIASNGQLHSYFVDADTGQTRPCFKQVIIANVCAAFVADMHNHGHNQLFVSLSDRVLRSYQFVAKQSDANLSQSGAASGDFVLLPQNKWETPEQITCVTHSESALSSTVLLSQLSPHFVRLRWHRENEANRTDEPAIDVETLDAEQKTQLSIDESEDSCAFIPWNCVSARIYMCPATKLLLHEAEHPLIQLVLPDSIFRAAFVIPLVLSFSRLLLVVGRLPYKSTVTLSGRAVFYLMAGTRLEQQSNQMHPVAKAQLATNLVACDASVHMHTNSIQLLLVTADLSLLLYHIDIGCLLDQHNSTEKPLQVTIPTL